MTTVTDLAWLEAGWRIDINNSTNNGNQAPKPIYSMEAVRDLGQTSWQGYPFNLSFIPNSLAFTGQWFPNTVYPFGYGQSMTPISPVQQFVDANGNLLYIDSTVLGLNINSPGYTTTPINLPPNAPYGTSGSTQPLLAADTPAGQKVLDGTVTWTVADPNAYAIRVAGLPALSSIVWLMQPVYQRKAPTLTSLQNTIDPIPPEYAYLFRQGFLAMCYDHAGSKKAPSAYAKWEEALETALREADREREDASFYPSESIMAGGGGSLGVGLPVGPAWPYGYFGSS